jgi:hypothetical protein
VRAPGAPAEPRRRNPGKARLVLGPDGAEWLDLDDFMDDAKPRIQPGAVRRWSPPQREWDGLGLQARIRNARRPRG